MEDKHIVTIDLGTEKLGVSVATIDDNRKITLAYYNEFPSAGIKHSRVSNPSLLASCLKDALSKVESVMHIRISEVMVNIQRYGVRQLDCNVNARTTNGTNVSEADIDLLDSMAWDMRDSLEKDEEIVACIAQSYDLDNGEINVSPDEVVGMWSENICCHYRLYAIKQVAVNIIDNAFKDSGIINVRKVFVPDAVGACVLSENEKQAGAALIDLGAGATSVSIFQGGVLKHYGAIPFGGNNITYDIANLCGISETLAENIKMAYGGCMPERLGTLGEKKLRIMNKLDNSRREISVKYLSEIITARQREIIDAILYEIQASGYADRLKNGVVLTGGGASMLNIGTFIKELSGYNTKVGGTSRDMFQAEDTIFFSLGASQSSGLLRKYSVTETAGCETFTETPAKEEAVTGPAPQQEPQQGIPQDPVIEENGTNEGQLFGGFFGGFFGQKMAKEAKKKRPATVQKPVQNTAEPQEAMRQNEGLFNFGEDEEV